MTNMTPEQEQWVEFPGRWAEYLQSLGLGWDKAAEAEKVILARHHEEIASLKAQADTLRGQVAMLVNRGEKFRKLQSQSPFVDLDALCDAADLLDAALSNTQATAEAFVLEKQAEALEVFMRDYRLEKIYPAEFLKEAIGRLRNQAKEMK